MKRFVAIPILLVTALCLSVSDSGQVRDRQLFDFDWQFSKDDAQGADRPDFNASAWRKVDLPHDWSIEGPWDPANPTGGAGGNYPAGVGWYRKQFTLPDSARGKKILIEFDGVYENSEVWINGQSLGKWPYGYTSFAYDMTPHLKFGGQPNVLAVRADASAQPASRYYTGAGIFRNVYLTVTDPLRVAHWGTYVTTPKANAEAATVKVRTSVQNDRAGSQTITLTTQIVDSAGTVVASADADKNIAAGRTEDLDQTIEMTKPQLWSTETPNMYTLRSILKVGGQAVDAYTTPMGVREIAYDVNKGFLLNGQQVKMQGVCLHHDGGAVGSAVPEGVWERRLGLLKEMGCNAIRTAHNPFDPVFLDLCDRMGFLVMDEAFDEWTIRKVRFGYAQLFNDWYEKDVASLVRRDRNHPSVVMWSAGNEIGEQRSPGGDQVLAKLVAVFHREDPTRPVTAGMDNIFTDKGEAPDAFTSLLDIVGYNYVDRWISRRETMYADDRHDHPNWKFVGTESDGVGGSRNAYTLPPLPDETAAPATGPAGGSGGGRGGASYATSMVRGEALWKFIKTHAYVIGDFIWTGIDYLGETGGISRGAGSGRIDLAGFPKDGFYFYQSQWTTKPMIHLMPHWNWPAERTGQIVPVIAYTNCDTVELFVNGKSYGRKSIEFPRQGNAGGWNSYARPVIPGSTLDLHLAWDVAYAPGTVHAVGYRNHQIACETEMKTTGEPSAIKLAVDHPTVRANSRDVAHFTVTVVDSHGLPVPTANPMISFDLQGPAKIIGTDNGNLSDTTSNVSKERRAMNGMALAIIQTTREAGKIRLTARPERMQPVTIEIDSQFVPAGKKQSP